MQASTKGKWSRKSKKAFKAEELRKLKGKAENIAQGLTFPISKRSTPRVAEAINEFLRIEAFTDTNKKKTGKAQILSSARGRVIKTIIDADICTASQLKVINSTSEEILFHREYRNQLIEYIEDKYQNCCITAEGFRKFAVNGKPIDYSELENLKEALKEAKEYEDSMREAAHKRTKKEVLETDDLIQPAIDHAKERRIELENKVFIEVRRCSAEKSKPENLCYFILYEFQNCIRDDLQVSVEKGEYVPSHDNPDDWMIKKVEDSNMVRIRIQSLSKYNLEILVGITCNIHNEKHASDILSDSKLQRKIKRRKKSTTAEEKKQIVQACKAQNMTQSQTVTSTGFGRTTVVRYWKN